LDSILDLHVAFKQQRATPVSQMLSSLRLYS
jgi:hypothetical protein